MYIAYWYQYSLPEEKKPPQGGYPTQGGASGYPTQATSYPVQGTYPQQGQGVPLGYAAAPGAPPAYQGIYNVVYTLFLAYHVSLI